MRTRGATWRLTMLLVPLLLVLPAWRSVLAAPSPHGGGGAQATCRSCHNAHYAPYGPLLDTPNDDRNCLSCHTDQDGPVFDRAAYRSSKHYDDKAVPAAAKALTPVPVAIAAPQVKVPGLQVVLRRDLLRLEREGGDAPEEGSAATGTGRVAAPEEPVRKTCVNCHTPHGWTTAAEKLLRQGTMTSSNEACGSCHPVQGKSKSFAGLKLYERASIHADSRKGAKWEGTNYARGECVNCHDPHGTASPGMLRKSGDELCYACHVKVDTATTLWPGDKAYRRSAHAALCLDCHNPHGALDQATGQPARKLLAKGAGAAFCFTCHKPIAVQYALSAARMSALKGLTSRHPANAPGAPVKCVDCHNPHVVRNKDVAGYEPTLSDPTKPTKAFWWYQGNASGEFCLKCHDGSRQGAPNIVAEMKDARVDNSGFKRAGDQVSLHNLHLTRYHKQKCSGCHQPHASEGSSGINRGKLLFDLTVNDYNNGYQGFNSCDTACHTKRCASCHPLPK